MEWTCARAGRGIDGSSGLFFFVQGDRTLARSAVNGYACVATLTAPGAKCFVFRRPGG